MPTKKKAQIGMDEKIVSNSELLALLEERETLKEGASRFRAKDKEAKDAILKLDEEPPYRIGGFLITKKNHNGRHVEFDINSGTTIKIDKAEE